MRPSRSAFTCWAVVGLGRPDKLALGAAMGTPAARIRARAVLWSGMRTATVGSPAATWSGTRLLRLKIRVRGPGQKASINSRASSGTRVHRSFTSLFLATWRIRGLSEGRPLARKMPSTAAGSRPLAPRPYTVSVGKATSPPERMMEPASRTPFSFWEVALKNWVCILGLLPFSVPGKLGRPVCDDQGVDHLVHVPVQEGLQPV